MILCVGDSVKLGHLREALEQRLHQEVTFLPAAPDIRRQENDILLAAQGTDAIIYDTDAYAIHPNTWKSLGEQLVVIHRTGYLKLRKNFYFKG